MTVEWFAWCNVRPTREFLTECPILPRGLSTRRLWSAVTGPVSDDRAASAHGRREGATQTDRPAAVTTTEAAIYNAAAYSVPPSSLLERDAVAGAVRQLRERLESAGLLTTKLQRRAIRRWGLPCFALVLLGVIRIDEGSRSNHPTGYLMLVTALALFAGLYLRTEPPATMTRAGRAAVTKTRSQHRHLQRSSNPSYITYGAAAAAMGVALFGADALFHLDPAFAAQAEIHRTATGDSSGSDNGSSCSSSGCGGCGG
jgi:uncharacterized protein (TIGR04222 family)